jgi:hypothetical protein
MLCSGPVPSNSSFRKILETPWQDFEPMKVESSFEKTAPVVSIDLQKVKKTAAVVSLLALGVFLGIAFIGCSFGMAYGAYLMSLENVSLIGSAIGLESIAIFITGLATIRFSVINFSNSDFHSDYHRLPRDELRATVTLSLWDFSTDSSKKTSPEDDFKLMPQFSPPSSTECS